MSIPSFYLYLQHETGPRHLLKALEVYGVREHVGIQHNPVIMGWAKETGLQHLYTADETPWCGLFIAVIMQRAGRAVVEAPLWALNWRTFGVAANTAMLGDVLTFTRSGGGHVGLYVGEDESAFHVLGGNQGNAVSIVRIERKRLRSIRRPPYSSQPTNIRKIRLTAIGEVSGNEA